MPSGDSGSPTPGGGAVTNKMKISFDLPDHQALGYLKAIMSKIDSDAQKVLKELAEFKAAYKAKVDEAQALNEQLAAVEEAKTTLEGQLAEAQANAVSAGVATDLAAEAEVDEAPQPEVLPPAPVPTPDPTPEPTPDTATPSTDPVTHDNGDTALQS